MTKISTLSEVRFEDLFAAFNDAFNDYERTWNKNEFEKMLYRRGFVPELSFGAFDEQKLLSFTLNGIGLFNGIRTAYDTGTGTLKAYRGLGLATKIFQESLPYFKQASISQYLLEVIQNNSKAISIYTNIGFKISREFNYFVQPVNEIRLNSKKLPPEYGLKEIDIMTEQMIKIWDFMPSWQNNFAAVSKKISDFKIIGAFNESKLIGYGMIEPASGDIPQLAVNKIHRRKGLGSSIFKELLKYNNANSVKVVNTDAKFSNISNFLANHHIPIRGTQFEMIKDLL